MPAPSASVPAVASPSPASIDIHSPQQVWAAVLQLIAQRPPLHWARSLQLHQLDDRIAHLSLQPGQRDLAKFVAAPQRRDQLAELFQHVLGRPIRIELISSPSSDAASSHDNLSSAASSASTGSVSSAVSGSSASSVGASFISPTSASGDRQKAMQLSMVKKVLEVFDASIIHIASQQPSPASSADTASPDDLPPSSTPDFSASSSHPPHPPHDLSDMPHPDDDPAFFPDDLPEDPS